MARVSVMSSVHTSCPAAWTMATIAAAYSPGRPPTTYTFCSAWKGSSNPMLRP